MQDRADLLERAEANYRAGNVESGDGAGGGRPRDESREVDPRGPAGHPPLLVSRGPTSAPTPRRSVEGSTFGAIEESGRGSPSRPTTGLREAGATGASPSRSRSERSPASRTRRSTGATAQMPSPDAARRRRPVWPSRPLTPSSTRRRRQPDHAALRPVDDVTSFVERVHAALGDQRGARRRHRPRPEPVDLTAIQTAAGSVTAFDAANLDRNVRHGDPQGGGRDADPTGGRRGLRHLGGARRGHRVRAGLGRGSRLGLDAGLRSAGLRDRAGDGRQRLRLRARTAFQMFSHRARRPRR